MPEGRSQLPLIEIAYDRAMRSLVVVVVVVLAGGACKSKSAEPTRGAGSAVVAADATVAIALDSAPTDAVAAAGPPPCGEVTIDVRRHGHRVKRDREMTVQDADMESALRALAAVCKGPITVKADNDVTYENVITVMDLAKKVGFHQIGLASPGDDKYPRPANKPPLSPTHPIDRAPIVIVTKTDIAVAFGKGERVTVGTIDAVDDKALDEALMKVPPGDTHLILQADAATSAKTINQIILAGKRAGYHDVLFAVRQR